jgi:CubicO group peptidase (beta-lactamase class C family)
MMANAPKNSEDVEAIVSEPQIMPQFIPAIPHAYLFDGSANDFIWQGPSFDYNVFAANIEAAMDGNAIGYAYAINLLGQSVITGADGAAQTPVDGDIDQTASKRMTVASISKTVTAVAVLQLLEKNGLTIDDPIAPWLPSDWTLGLNIVDLTFRHLLTHRSGYANWGTGGSWASLQSMVASNQADAAAEWDYENNNYALFRVIIPALWIATMDNNNYPELNEGLAALMYIAYVQLHIFDPIGVNQAMCMNNGNSDPVLLYDVNNPNVAGWETGDYGLNCGAYGWNLSAIDLAAFMAHIRYNDDILSPASRELMDEYFLGWRNPDDWGTGTVGEHGVYYAHGGKWQKGGREFQGCIMKFPIHVEAVLLINSSENFSGEKCGLLRQAFDDAYVN